MLRLVYVVCLVAAFAAVAGLAAPASATMWDFNADWDTVNQTGSVWHTGYLTDDEGNFHQYTSPTTCEPAVRWDVDGDPDTYGCTNKNTTSNAYENWSMYWEPGMTTLMPSITQSWCTARFVAPAAGQYAITATWTNQRTDGGATNARLLRGREAGEDVWDAQLFSEELNGFVGRAVNNYSDATGTNPSAEYSATLTLSAGQVLDFVAAPNINYGFNTTGINVTISTVPEPGTCVLACLGAIGLLAYAWRRRK
jgi:hypothetical protein